MLYWHFMWWYGWSFFCCKLIDFIYSDLNTLLQVSGPSWSTAQGLSLTLKSPVMLWNSYLHMYTVTILYHYRAIASNRQNKPLPLVIFIVFVDKNSLGNISGLLWKTNCPSNRGFIKFLCRRSMGFYSRAFWVFLMKESKKRRWKEPGKVSFIAGQFDRCQAP